MKQKACARCGHPFFSNPIIQGDDVCRTCERLCSINFWYPPLFHSGLPVPRTIIVNADIDLLPLTDGHTPKGIGRFMDELRRAIELVGLPAFLRTEMLSNKHDWERSCFLNSADEKILLEHLSNLVEMSAIATIDRITPCDFFAIREFLPTEPAFTYFNGKMPITNEVRIFVRDGEIVCKHPYWPAEVFEEVPSEQISSVRALTPEDEKVTDHMALFVSKLFTGYWSVDFLKTKKGWYCTDMAIGERSFHQPHTRASTPAADNS